MILNGINWNILLIINFIYIFISLENVGNVSEVKREVINNNVCVDYNHESDESKNRYISDSIEAFPPKTISGQKKRQSFECEVCHKMFDSLVSLNYHKKAYHNVNVKNVHNIDFEFGSNVLQQSTSNVNSQLTLNVQKTSDDRLKCPIDSCEQVFKSEDSIESHIKEHDIDSEDDSDKSQNDCQKISDKTYKQFDYQFSCKHKGCAFRADSRRQMEMHNKSHFVCTYDGCREKFSMDILLKKHIKCFHKSVKLKFVCPIEGCVRVYSHKRDVNRHILTGHTKREVVCTYEGCDKKFSTEKIMKSHVFRVHQAEAVKVKCDWPGCDYVGLKGTVYSHRLRHQNQNKPKSLVCNRDNCGQSFSCEQLLREHIHDVHNADRLLKCRHSGCTFETNKSREMKRHFPKHKKWLSCDWPECDKMYKFKLNLEEHINAFHKNIKPHVCSEPGCEYRTAYKANLTEHAKTHQDAQARRKVPCDWPGCTYVAKFNTDLKTHMVSHSDERPFACDWPGCDWKFKTINQRNRHIETHSDEKNMVCDCGKRFKTRHNLGNHKRSYCHYNK